ncbi:hypothetical protein DOK67_0000861 [Enterococcus sp. DIV0212c]|uniref:hypothetical protein n=1 Tax=Enterococcus sp. DIV0212c TaxID=2230867 RepID=UPI001A9B7C2A|nr:hypothetical protein [Enterococcus sp. DIV0212c]MBO1353740.1 hypothetical protein [Enterococcus sp. DIV0212c]
MHLNTSKLKIVIEVIPKSIPNNPINGKDMWLFHHKVIVHKTIIVALGMIDNDSTILLVSLGIQSNCLRDNEEKESSTLLA